MNVVIVKTGLVFGFKSAVLRSTHQLVIAAPRTSWAVEQPPATAAPARRKGPSIKDVQIITHFPHSCNPTTVFQVCEIRQLFNPIRVMEEIMSSNTTVQIKFTLIQAPALLGLDASLPSSPSSESNATDHSLLPPLEPHPRREKSSARPHFPAAIRYLQMGQV